MNWREKFYETYVSGYLAVARGGAVLRPSRAQFRVWSSYYGSHLPGGKGAAILDVGCGNGELLVWLKTIGYTNASGVDASREQVETSRRLGVSNVVQADFRTFLADKKNRFDCIIARDFIEHFDKEEIHGVVTALFDALRPGGTLLLQTPNAESPFGSRYRYTDFTHGLSFTRTSLVHVLRTCGFRTASFHPMRPVPHGVISLIRFILWRCIELALSTYLLIETGSGRAIFTQNMIAVARK